MSIRLQRANVERDADILCGLDAACFPEDALPDLVGADWWIAWNGEQPVGYVAVNFRHGSIDRYGVIPSQRKRGLGRRLIAHAIHVLRCAGWAVARTYTSADNGASINVFIALGFRWALCERARAPNRRTYWFITWQRNLLKPANTRAIPRANERVDMERRG